MRNRNKNQVEKHKKIILKKVERFRTTLDNMLEGCQIIDHNWVYLYINNAAEKHNKRPNEELIGKKYMDMWPGIEGTEVFTVIKKCMDERVHQNMENVFTFPDGTKGCFDLRIVPIPEGVFILSIDCTESKQVSEELDKLNISLELKFEERTKELSEVNRRLAVEIERNKQVNDRLNLVIESAPNAIILVNSNGIIQFVNKQVENYFCYNHSELINHKIEKLVPYNYSVNHLKLRSEYISHPTGRKMGIGRDLYGLRKDGVEIPVEVGLNPITIDNETFILVSIIDITERKKNEEELVKAKNAADGANKMKSEFLANMSHEIRTPLNAIVGFSSILKEKVAGQKMFTEYLENILQSSKVLLNLINDILDLSKVEAGRMVIDYQPVNLKRIVNEIQSVFQIKAQGKGISINILIADDIPWSLLTDEKYLRQILFNLIGNAVKFTHKGGVDVIVNIIPKNKESSKVDVKFTIKDTGIGISVDQLTGIFEPFVQAKQKNKNIYGGTGLGLSITKRLVELLGGKISVESEFGIGSVFNFYLFNVEIASLQNTEKSDKEIRNLMGIRFYNPIILIAEDILSNRQVIKNYLEPLNITIIETENGEECISAIRIKRPDLILMDMQMPVMDGYTAMSIIKSNDSLKNIPVIALTASGIKHQTDKFEIIADSFLIKPIYKNELLEQLIKYLPYEEPTETTMNLDDKLSQQTEVNNEHKLLPEIKEEIVNRFVPDILKLEKTMNIDEIIEFIKKMEEFNKKHQIEEITKYCKNLSEYVESFNIDKIIVELKKMLCFINK